MEEQLAVIQPLGVETSPLNAPFGLPCSLRLAIRYHHTAGLNLADNDEQLGTVAVKVQRNDRSCLLDRTGKVRD